MELRNKEIQSDNRNLTLVLIPVVAIVAKIIQIYILPDKYFFDAWRMLGMMYGGENTMAAWGGYQQTVDFYLSIDWFHLETLTNWSVFLGIIMNPVMMVIVSFTKRMTLRESIYILMATGIMNIYVFTIGKEMIQLGFFVFIFIAIKLPIKSSILKVILCAAIYFWESSFYRGYYIIMAAMTVVVYVIFKWLQKRVHIRRIHVTIAVIMCFAAVFLMFYVCKYIRPDDFDLAINVRDDSANAGAASAILNPIPVNGNYAIFMLTYILAAIRMMIPVELLLKSPIYAPFVVYQIFILFYFIKGLIKIKQLDDSMLTALCCFVAYLFGSFIFEPDFGSWVRHEAATFPILQMIALEIEQRTNKSGTIGNRRIKEVVIYEN